MTFEEKKSAEAAALAKRHNEELAQNAKAARDEIADNEFDVSNEERFKSAIKSAQRRQIAAQKDRENRESALIRASDAQINRDHVEVFEAAKMDEMASKRAEADDRDAFLDQAEQFRRQRHREVRFEDAHEKAEQDEAAKMARKRVLDEAEERRRSRADFDDRARGQIGEKRKQRESEEKQKILELEEIKDGNEVDLSKKQTKEIIN